MCEMLVVRSNEAVPFESILPYALLLDEYGVAGFGWGVAWLGTDGRVRRYRTAEGIRRDPAVTRSLTGVRSTRYLIHLRRPSAMTTIAHRNAQPYLTASGDTAFAHNGYFARHRDYRPQYQDRLEGSSDSEVGFFLYLDQIADGMTPGHALQEVHRKLEGHANIGALHGDGTLLLYAGNRENAVYTFELGTMQMATTALHSMDDFVFQVIFPNATGIRQVPVGRFDPEV